MAAMRSACSMKRHPAFFAPSVRRIRDVSDGRTSLPVAHAGGPATAAARHHRRVPAGPRRSRCLTKKSPISIAYAVSC